MSSKVSNPGAFDTSPARAAKRRSNSSARSAGTVMALMRTTLISLPWSPLSTVSRTPASAGGASAGSAARAESLMAGSGRTVLFVVYSTSQRGNLPNAHPLRGMREDRGVFGRPPGSRAPSLVSRRAVPAPVRRLASFFCADHRRGWHPGRLPLVAEEPLDLRRELLAGRNVARTLGGLDVAHHLGHIRAVRQPFLDALQVLVGLTVERREVDLDTADLTKTRQQRTDRRRRG